jgi:hypothetical protein
MCPAPHCTLRLSGPFPFHTNPVSVASQSQAIEAESRRPEQRKRLREEKEKKLE